MTDEQALTLAAAAGIHIGGATAAFLAIAKGRQQPTKELRAEYLRVCAEVFDETARDAGLD